MWTTFTVVLCGLQAAQAVNVYLYPPQMSLPSSFAPEDASAALSRHLGLEIFETLRDGSYSEESFVAQGPNNALLLTLDEADAKGLSVRIPSSLHSSFELPTPQISSLSSVISTYLHHASHTYTSIFSADPSSQSRQAWYTAELDSLVSFFDGAQGASFAAAELSGLATMRTTHGADSDEYRTTLAATRKVLDYAIAHDIRVALLTFSPVTHTELKRAPAPQLSQAPFPRPPPQSPIGSVSTCHTTLDACSNATSSCSGRGECAAASKSGRTCFVCSCGTTRTGEGRTLKTATWVGESCERKDISGPFVLLAGTTIVLLLVIAGSISLLYSVGNIELPSVLMGGAVNAKKD
ncbi:hypothetical protein B0H17DRAFT_1019207 [Mycena rosella]|uniref:Vacuolar sorting protein Vps3844 C-terminal domain-containing protein n=1 Tax=Mycena rosella TaxID=1033263 RepID=A0AAD7CVZ5_MYCRO|nr:hypothetical protein B0H17DRAFT_1019207 [Mycena rosella]